MATRKIMTAFPPITDFRLCDTHYGTPISLALNVSEPTVIKLSIEHDAALISSAPSDSCEQAGSTKIYEQSLTRNW